MIPQPDDGGPAFPVVAISPPVPPGNFSTTSMWPGMSIRDYFAAHAMQGLILHWAAKESAELAYECADAMLKARESRS